MEDLWTRLQQVLSSKLPDDYANWAVQELKLRQINNPRGTLSDFGYGPQHGLNVVSSPETYYPRDMKKNTKIEPSLGYHTGGDFSMLGGVRVNPDSLFDKTATSTHEAQHWKDWITPETLRRNREYVSEEDANANRQSDQTILKKITERLQQYKASAPSNLRNYRILSGQADSDEIVPQLRSYESMLPAGMSLQQSPLGKALFTDNAEKLWYINKTQPSMIDQSYLDELFRREEKRKK